MHDIWIKLNTELIGKPIFLDTKLIYYRRHGGNLSSAAEKSSCSFRFKIWYRIIFIKELLQRYTERKILNNV
jgi:hypothetical protein